MCRCSNSSSAPAVGPLDRVQLPREVVPSKYILSIRPDLENFTFSGSVSINLAARISSNVITLNSVELDITKASLCRADSSVSPIPLSVSYDTVAQTAALSFDGKPFAVGELLVLVIDYTGNLNDNMVGFYRSKYDVEGVVKHMAVTQFEAVDCRRALPSFDEPELKAVFNVSIVAKKEFTALSNTEVVNSHPLKSDPSYTVHNFGDSPLMSTYLLAFAVGEFDYIEEITTPSKHLPKSVRCRIYTTRGDSERGRFALDVCVKTLEHFSEIFGIPYPLSKCDQIAVPDFSAGAMENWGLITYRTASLLTDSKTGSVQTKMRIATTVTHELAHQWFGNLVTFKFWDELWLNEGFATWVGTYGAAHLFKEWDMWSMFVSEDLHYALGADGVRTSHPIHVPVRDGAEISQIFDGISYSKGASVINMLTNWLGLEVFFKGIRLYLKTHEYANADTGDLWRALSDVSGQNVSMFMDYWVTRVGYPVVSAVQKRDSASGITRLSLTQHRFLSSGDVADNEDETIWHVPLDLVPVSDLSPASSSSSVNSSPGTKLPASDSQATLVSGLHQSTLSLSSSSQTLNDSNSTLVLDSRSADFDVHGESTNYFVNGNRMGFYRVAYDNETLSNIAKALASTKSNIPLTTRMGIYSDAFALARGGVTSVTGFFSLLLSALERESAYSLFADVINAMSTVKSVWAGESQQTRDQIDALNCRVFEPHVKRLGLTPKPEESVLDRTLRPLVISTLAMSNHNETTKAVLNIFNNFITKKQTISSDLYKCVFSVAIAKSGENEAKVLESVMKLYEDAPESSDLKYAALSALGQAQDKSLIAKVLTYSISSKVRPQSIHYVWGSLSTNPTARRQLFDFLVENWALLSDRYKSNFDMVGSCVSYATCRFTTQADFEMVMDFFNSHDMTKCERKVNESISAMKVNISWLSRDRQAVNEWLAKKITASN